MNISAQLKLLDDEVGNLCGQISDFQRIAGVSSSNIVDEDRENAEKMTSVEKIRQILRSQLENLVWVDKHSGNLFPFQNMPVSLTSEFLNNYPLKLNLWVHDLKNI
jgi:hypothetical protein